MTAYVQAMTAYVQAMTAYMQAMTACLQAMTARRQRAHPKALKSGSSPPARIVVAVL